MINLSTGAFYERSASQIGTLRTRAESLQKMIGSGDRLERSSDDPVAAARLRTLARGERLAEVDNRNSQLAQADLQLTDQALTSIADIVIRVRELALQGASQTLSDDQRASLGSEVASLRESLILLANSRNAGGHALLGGQAIGQAYVDTNGVAGYVGTDSVDPLEIGEGQSVTPGVTGEEVFGVNDDPANPDLFKVLANLSAALTAGGSASSDASSAALTALDTGLERVTTAQTLVGSRLNWVDLMDERREKNSERVASEKGDVGGADIALTMTRLQETLTVLEATQASFVKLANLSLFSMIR